MSGDFATHLYRLWSLGLLAAHALYTAALSVHCAQIGCIEVHAAQRSWHLVCALVAATQAWRHTRIGRGGLRRFLRRRVQILQASRSTDRLYRVLKRLWSYCESLATVQPVTLTPRTRGPRPAHGPRARGSLPARGPGWVGGPSLIWRRGRRSRWRRGREASMRGTQGSHDRLVQQQAPARREQSSSLRWAQERVGFSPG